MNWNPIFDWDRYLREGQRRLAVLSTLRGSRFPGQRGPSRGRPQLVATPARGKLAALIHQVDPRDLDLLQRAIEGQPLQPWERRRVEYLARKGE